MPRGTVLQCSHRLLPSGVISKLSQHFHPNWKISANSELRNHSTDIVTFDGSPPNSQIYFCTQRSAMRSVRLDVSTLIMPTVRTLTIPQPEIAYTGVFDFLASQEPEG